MAESPLDERFVRGQVRARLFGEPCAAIHLGRYRLLRVLGRGSTGVVYEGVDSGGEHVALKTWRGPGDVHGARLAREFRALRDLRHENLVPLYELAVDGADSFFTMALVEGEPCVPANRPLPPASLAERFTQLASCVQFMHGAGRIHCDIKPSNVLCEEGRVVVLDFGLSRETEAAAAGFPLGTPAYMAPEIWDGEPPSPASDWFAVGVMLHQALAGAHPHGASAEGPRGRLQPASSITEQGPWGEICASLLQVSPSRRQAGIDRLLARCAAPQTNALSLAWRSSRSTQVDRHTVEAVLSGLALSRSGPVAALVVGTGGAGKSATLEASAKRLASESGARVMRVRCDPQETLHRRGLDRIAQQVVDGLGELPDQTRRELEDDVAALAEAFPSFGHAVARGTSSLERAPCPATALNHLLCALTRFAPVVVIIDDAQWGDMAGAQLLLDLWSMPDPAPVFWLAATSAVDPVDAPLAAAFARSPLAPTRRITLPLGSGSDSDNDPRVAHLMEPLLRRLTEPARALLQVLAVARRPIGASHALEISGAASHAQASLAELRAGSWIWEKPAAEGVRLAMAAPVLRQAVLADLGPERQRSLGARLAEQLEAESEASHDAAYEHLRTSGDLDGACEHAKLAALEAERDLAHGRAAELWTWLSDQQPSLRAEHLERAGDALASAGQVHLATRSLRASARAHHDPHARRRLRHRAAALDCERGRIREAIPELKGLLREAGLRWPSSRPEAMARGLALSTAWRLRDHGLDAQPRMAGCDLASFAAADLAVTARNAVSTFDSTRTYYFIALQLHTALRTRDPSRMARAFAAQAGMLSLTSPGSPTVDRLLARAQELTPEGDAVGAGELLTAQATHHLAQGRFTEALACARRAESALHGVAGLGPYLAGVRRVMANTLYWLGDVVETSSAVAKWIVQARAAGDIWGEIIALTHPLLISDDDLVHARRRLSEARLLATENVSPTAMTLMFHPTELFLAIYEGDLEAAQTLVRRAGQEPELLALRTAGEVDRHFRLQAQEVTLARVARGDLPLERLDDVARKQRRMHRKGLGWALPLGQRNLAAVAALRGQQNEALNLLADAQAGFEARGMRLYALCTRRRVAELSGRTEDIAAIDARLIGTGIRNPARCTDVLAPGFPRP